MIYYQHKKTKDIIGVTNCLIDQIDGEDNLTMVTMVVIPSRRLGNGILFHTMSFVDINKNYKRTSKKAAFEMYPDFGQLRHVHTIENYDIKHKATNYLEQLIPLRDKGFGYGMIENHPLCPNGSKLAEKAKKNYEKNGLLSTVIYIKEKLKTDLKTARDIVKSFKKSA